MRLLTLILHLDPFSLAGAVFSRVRHLIFSITWVHSCWLLCCRRSKTVVAMLWHTLDSDLKPQSLCAKRRWRLLNDLWSSSASIPKAVTFFYLVYKLRWWVTLLHTLGGQRSDEDTARDFNVLYFPTDANGCSIVHGNWTLARTKLGPSTSLFDSVVVIPAASPSARHQLRMSPCRLLWPHFGFPDSQLTISCSHNTP